MFRNGVGDSDPFLIMRMRPLCSATNKRPLPSPAWVMLTGCVNPEIGDDNTIDGNSAAALADWIAALDGSAPPVNKAASDQIPIKTQRTSSLCDRIHSPFFFREVLLRGRRRDQFNLESFNLETKSLNGLVLVCRDNSVAI